MENEKKDKNKLYEKSSPYTSVQYYDRNMHPRQLEISRETYSQKEAPHLHNEIEILYVISGKGTLQVNGINFPFEAGHIAWLYPYHVHAVIPDKKLKCFVLQFSLGMLTFLSIDKNMTSDSTVFDFAPPCVELRQKIAQKTLSLLEELETEISNKNYGYELMGLSAIIQLITIFERENIANAKAELESKRDLAWIILQYTQFYFNKKISTKTIGDKFGISSQDVNRLLHRLTGMNFSQNLALTRVRNACAMMQYSELTLPYISHYVGYSSLASFYRQFKSIKGDTPDKYRSNNILNQPRHMHPSDTARSLIAYIAENYQEDINIKTASKAFFCTESAIVSTLQEGYGLSFEKLLATVRLWVSAALLKGTELYVADVAVSAGFKSTRTFDRQFKEYYKCTPAQYRKLSPEETYEMAF